jgi:hypothetical protein
MAQRGADARGGLEFRPDPREARDDAELMQAVRRYRVWAGEPSYRDMERTLSQMQTVRRLGTSTLHTILNKDQLPRLETFIALLTACGAPAEDQVLFVAAWRRIRLRESPDDMTLADALRTSLVKARES